MIRFIINFLLWLKFKLSSRRRMSSYVAFELTNDYHNAAKTAKKFFDCAQAVDIVTRGVEKMRRAK